MPWILEFRKLAQKATQQNGSQRDQEPSEPSQLWHFRNRRTGCLEEPCSIFGSISRVRNRYECGSARGCEISCV